MNILYLITDGHKLMYTADFDEACDYCEAHKDATWQAIAPLS